MLTNDDVVVQGEELLQHLTNNKDLTHYVNCLLFIMDMDKDEAFKSYKQLRETYTSERIDELTKSTSLRKKFKKFEQGAIMYICRISADKDLEDAPVIALSSDVKVIRWEAAIDTRDEVDDFWARYTGK